MKYDYASFDNLLDVVRILRQKYVYHTIYVGRDSYGFEMLKFKHDTENLDFELVLLNDFDLMPNRKYETKANVKKILKDFRKAMIEVCGENYLRGLLNYLNYEHKQIYLKF